jgi:polar amino acid transport system substrate-binding protein
MAMDRIRRLIAAIAATVFVAGLAGGQVARAQEASTWDEIAKRGSLRIGVVNTAPWFIQDPKTKDWSGTGVSIGQAMAEALGVKFEPVEVQWGTSIPALQSKKIDIMFFLDPTPERAKAADFPLVPVVDIALGVLVEDGIKAATWQDLNNDKITVAVPQGTSMDRHVTATLTKAQILRFPSNAEAVAAFQSKRANVASMFLPPLIMLQSKIGRGSIVIPKPLVAGPAGAAVRIEPDKRFRDWAGASIFFWYHSGQISKWYKQTLTSQGIDPAKVPSVVRSEW